MSREGLIYTGVVYKCDVVNFWRRLALGNVRREAVFLEGVEFRSCRSPHFPLAGPKRGSESFAELAKFGGRRGPDALL